MNVASCLAVGLAALMLSDADFVRTDLHICAAVGLSLNFFYVGSAGFTFTLSHAIFKAITEGVIGGRTKSYLCFGWGLPFAGEYVCELNLR